MPPLNQLASLLMVHWKNCEPLDVEKFLVFAFVCSQFLKLQQLIREKSTTRAASRLRIVTTVP